MKKEDLALISARIPKDLKERIEREALEEDRDISKQLRKIIRDYYHEKDRRSDSR